MTPHPFFPVSAQNTTMGRDCTAIAGAEGVACVNGQCSVNSCADGWIVGPNGNECIKYGWIHEGTQSAVGAVVAGMSSHGRGGI